MTELNEKAIIERLKNNEKILALKIIKKDITTKDGKTFPSYIGIYGTLKIGNDDKIEFSDCIIKDVFLNLKTIKQNIRNFEFPITIIEPKEATSKEDYLKSDFSHLPKKDKNGKYIKYKNGEVVYRFVIYSINDDKLILGNSEVFKYYVPKLKTANDALKDKEDYINSKKEIEETSQINQDLPF